MNASCVASALITAGVSAIGRWLLTRQRMHARVGRRCASWRSIPRLRTLVEDNLACRWSPQQIAGWLARTYPDDAELQVSHETIYRTLYVQSRGALRKELARHLRTRRGMRRPKNNGSKGGGRVQHAGLVHISQRPAEAEDRAMPGHWEGDLVCGTNGSAVATLVERWSRFLLLVKLDGMRSEIRRAGPV